MQTKLHTFLLFLGMLLFFSLHSFSQTSYHKEIPELPSTPRLVNDFADMLSDDEEMQLETKLFNFEKATSNEVTIVTVNRLGDLEISQFAEELGRKWNIGKENKKNGVLILASKEDHKINISPGYGLSGALPDITCGQIIRNSIVPNFKNKDYYQGFDEATSDIIAASKGEFTNDEPQKSSKAPKSFLVLIAVFFIMMRILFFFFRRRGGGMYMSRRGYRDGGLGSFGAGFLGGMLGGGGFGGNDNDSGGGFGGFGGGGGGFDGGGASGSW